jgi:hypothetical protein
MTNKNENLEVCPSFRNEDESNESKISEIHSSKLSKTAEEVLMSPPMLVCVHIGLGF